MLQSKKLNYQDLQVEQYVPTGLPEYWKKNRNIFKLDSVGFLYLWGGTSIWISIVIASLVTAVAAFPGLPPQIPVQWSDNSVVNLARREFIFAYPAACFLCRILLRPSAEGWLRKRIFVLYSTQIADYLTNFLCFVLLSIEFFTLLFVKGILENVVMVLAVDSAVLIGLLLIGYHKLTKAA